MQQITTIVSLNGTNSTLFQMVLDHETWVMDLDAANHNNSVPKWYKLYSVIADYGLEDLSPQAWDNLVTQMIQDSDIFNKFYG